MNEAVTYSSQNAIAIIQTATDEGINKNLFSQFSLDLTSPHVADVLEAA